MGNNSHSHGIIFLLEALYSLVLIYYINFISCSYFLTYLYWLLIGLVTVLSSIQNIFFFDKFLLFKTHSLKSSLLSSDRVNFSVLHVYRDLCSWALPVYMPLTILFPWSLAHLPVLWFSMLEWISLCVWAALSFRKFCFFNFFILSKENW